ncbi:MULTISPECIES: hypothetical protein [Pseudofrankia]|uniref:hypothetical protein n=1 Tax=Pseudofrankia TaxID=2994363 RepID=UPI000234C7A2|nr:MULTISPECIES: hypothetical protein [Pseudofrankia]OHV29439.1 hypothetical protein BCD49_36300 [Pseudofrankia sp. EUN1h]
MSAPHPTPHQLAAALAGIASAASVAIGLANTTDLFTAAWSAATLALIDALARALAVTAHPSEPDGPGNGHGA